MFLLEVGRARGADAGLDRALDDLGTALRSTPSESRARYLVESMALALQASLLARHAPNEVADAFIGSRLAGGLSGLYGSLPAAAAFRPIIDRARPSV